MAKQFDRAVRRGQSTLAALAVLCLLAVKGTATAADPEGALIAAVKDGRVAAVSSLVQKRANVNAREVDGTSALHWAVRGGSGEIAESLLAAGADPNAVNRYGVTPLSLAAAAGDATLLGALLRHGADVKRAEGTLPDGQTLLMLAARTGSVDTLKLLLARGENVNAREHRTGTTALMWAAIDDRADGARALLEAGAEVNARSAIAQYPHTPPAVIGDALEDGVSYVGQTVLPKGGWTALMYAAREGAVSAARALVAAGADPNITDPDGTSALIFTIINGHYDVTSVLLDHGADPNLPDRTGMTPLYAAVDIHTVATTFGRPDPPPMVLAGSVPAIEALLAHRADPNARLKTRILKRVYNPGDPRLGEGATSFMRAARAGDVAVMRLLLEHGADPALTQQNGNTPIILAAGISAKGNNPDRGTEQSAIEAIKLCLDLGADINATNNAGDTAVHVALGNPAIVRFLAGHGARLDVRNKRGRTPLEAALAARDIDEATVALLRQLSGPATRGPVRDDR